MKKRNIILIILIVIVAILIILFAIKSNQKKNGAIKTEDIPSSTQTDTISSESSIVGLDNISHIIVKVEDETSSQGLEYNEKTITDPVYIEQVLDAISDIVYFDGTIIDFGDCPATVELYNTDGTVTTISALDNYKYDGNSVNIISMWTTDENNKAIYIVSTPVEELIKNLYESSALVDNSDISYIELKIEDESSSQGLAYKEKKVTDEEKINALIDVIDSASLYEEYGFIPDLGDCPATATVYLNDGTSYSIAALDNYVDEGKTVNLMTKWTLDDGSDKKLYYVDANLEQLIIDTFNN